MGVACAWGLLDGPGSSGGGSRQFGGTYSLVLSVAGCLSMSVEHVGPKESLGALATLRKWIGMTSGWVGLGMWDAEHAIPAIKGDTIFKTGGRSLHLGCMEIYLLFYGPCGARAWSLGRTGVGIMVMKRTGMVHVFGLAALSIGQFKGIQGPAFFFQLAHLPIYTLGVWVWDAVQRLLLFDWVSYSVALGSRI